MRVERACGAFPLCGPSRNSFLTGLYPNSSGIHANAQLFLQSIPTQLSMPQAFRLAGYFAARIGKMYHYNVPMAVGTNGHDDPGSWELEINPAGCDRLEEEPQIVSLEPGKFGGTLSWYASPKGDRARPFFLAVGFYRPHTPYVAPQTPSFEMYLEAERPLVTGVAEDQQDMPKAALGSRKAEQDAMTESQR